MAMNWKQPQQCDRWSACLLAAAVALGSGCARPNAEGARAPDEAAGTAAEEQAVPHESAGTSSAASSSADGAGAAPSDLTTSSSGAAQLLAFLAVGRGDRVADLGAGAGYSILPLASAVGPYGVVYARHVPGTLTDLPGDPAAQGVRDSVPPNVVPMHTPDDAPFTREAKDLDLVTFLFAYHDVIARGIDRRKLNAAVFRALKPGRFYIVADHAAPEGSGLPAASSLNRIEDGVVRAEVQAVGFVFVEAAELASASATARGAHGGHESHTSQYILKFVKPQ